MKIVLFFLLTGGLNAYASLPVELSNMSCSKEVNIKLKMIKSKNQWTQTASPTTGVYSFRSPTDKFANWVMIQNHKEETKLIEFSPKAIKLSKWKTSTCDMFFSNTLPPLKLVREKKVKKFSDRQLEPKVLDPKKYSMIYIWGPGMVYSSKEMHVFKDVAKEYNMNFIPILGSKTDPKYAEKVIKNRKLNIEVIKNNSVELYLRDGENHYPTTFIVGNNVVSEKIFGVFPHDDLRRKIDEQLTAIKRGNK